MEKMEVEGKTGGEMGCATPAWCWWLCDTDRWTRKVGGGLVENEGEDGVRVGSG